MSVVRSRDGRAAHWGGSRRVCGAHGRRNRSSPLNAVNSAGVDPKAKPAPIPRSHSVRLSTGSKLQHPATARKQNVRIAFPQSLWWTIGHAPLGHHYRASEDWAYNMTHRSIGADSKEGLSYRANVSWVASLRAYPQYDSTSALLTAVPAKPSWSSWGGPGRPHVRI